MEDMKNRGTRATQVHPMPRVALVAAGATAKAMFSELPEGLPYLQRALIVEDGALSVRRFAPEGACTGEGGSMATDCTGGVAASGLEAGSRPLPLSQMKEAVEGIDLVFVVASLHEDENGEAAFALAYEAVRCGSVVLAVLVEPSGQAAEREGGVGTMTGALQACGVTVLGAGGTDRAGTAGARLPTGAEALRFRCFYDFVTRLVCEEGKVSVDLDDLRFLLGRGGRAAFGFSATQARSWSEEDVAHVLDRPLLGAVGRGQAHGVVVGFRGGSEVLSLRETGRAMKAVVRTLSDRAEGCFGVALDASLGSTLQMGVLSIEFLPGR